jgi:hypothetical protein
MSAADEFSNDGLLSPEESLDSDELGEDADDESTYIPLDFRPAELSWGFTPREAREHEPLAARLAREVPESALEYVSDGLGDTSDTDGELLDDEAGTIRAGRLVAADLTSLDPQADFWARDVGLDGAASSAEEAALHIVVETDDIN